MLAHILLVDDDPAFTHILSRALQRQQFRVTVAHTAETALLAAEQDKPDYAIIDLKLDGPSGLTLIEPLKARWPGLNILILTGYSSIATAVDAIKRGAHNYLCKPASAGEIIAALSNSPQQPVAPAATPPSVERVQWEHIQQVLQAHNGNISATARALGMHRRTLQRKLAKRPKAH